MQSVVNISPSASLVVRVIKFVPPEVVSGTNSVVGRFSITGAELISGKIELTK